MSGWNNPLPIGQSSGELYGGHGGTLTWMLGGHSSSRTDPGASSTYTTTDSRSSEPQCSLPLAFSSSSSLQLAFFVCLDPTSTRFLSPPGPPPLILHLFSHSRTLFPLRHVFSLSHEPTSVARGNNGGTRSPIYTRLYFPP